MRVLLFEKGNMDLGASRKNAGFNCYGSPTEVLSDMAKYGKETALATVEARWKGMQKMRKILAEERFDLEESGGHELFRERESLNFVDGELSSLNEELKARLGFTPYRRMEAGELNAMGFSGFEGGYRIAVEGMLDPYRLHSCLLKELERSGVKIRFGTSVEGLEERQGRAELRVQGFELPIKSRAVAIACNGFTPRLMDESGIEPARGQVLLTEPLEGLPFYGTFHLEEGNYYFRNVGGRVLLGGGRELDPERENTDQQGSNSRIREELERILSEHLLPGRSFRIEEEWSGIMGFTKDKRPLLETIGDRTFIMGGFSGMGVALSFWAGDRMAERILESLE
jgi:glycine/D-amino acid oxidase-like deaminating enzyme